MIFLNNVVMLPGTVWENKLQNISGQVIAATEYGAEINTTGVNYPPVIVFQCQKNWRIFTDQNALKDYLQQSDLSINIDACLEHAFFGGSTVFEWCFDDSYICPPISRIILRDGNVEFDHRYVELSKEHSDYEKAKRLFMAGIDEKLTNLENVDIGVSGGLDSRLVMAIANKAKNLTVKRCHMLVDVGGLLRSVDEKSAAQICNLYGHKLERLYFEKRTFDDLISGELNENLIGTCEALRSCSSAETVSAVHLTGSHGFLVQNPDVNEINIDWVLTHKTMFYRNISFQNFRKALNLLSGSTREVKQVFLKPSDTYEILRNKLERFFDKLTNLTPPEALLNYSYIVQGQKNALGMFESFNGKYYPVSIYADVIEPALASVHSADLDGRKFILRFLNDLDPRAKNVQGQGVKVLSSNKLRKIAALASIILRGSGVMNYRERARGIDGFYDEDEILSLHPFNELIQNRMEMDPGAWSNIRKINAITKL